MSLKFRLTVAIMALALAAVLLMGFVADRRVVYPLAEQMRGALIVQAEYLVRRDARGTPRAELEEAFDVSIRDADGPPPDTLRRGPPPRRRGRHEVRLDPESREVWIEGPQGWIIIQSQIDLYHPQRNLIRLVLLGSLGLGLLALAIAAAGTRPLQRAQEAMERVGRGDLDHRLDESGPTEIAAMAGAFNQMTRRVKELLDSERELLAGVSHELRTPLSRLRLSTELLRDFDVPERYLDGMEGDLAELDALIGELLDLSRLQLGDGVVQPEPTDLRALADDVAAEREWVRVEGQGAQLDVDPRLVRRALDNLVRNALAYAPDGDVVIDVLSDGFRVLDRGPGVPEAALPRLFDAFYRVDGSRSRLTGGVGVGLRIVAQVAELHGGEASAKNRDGGGLEVRLTLRSVPAGARR